MRSPSPSARMTFGTFGQAQAQQLLARAMLLNHSQGSGRAKEPAADRDVPSVEVATAGCDSTGLVKQVLDLEQARLRRRPPLAPDGALNGKGSRSRSCAATPGSEPMLDAAEKARGGLQQVKDEDGCAQLQLL